MTNTLTSNNDTIVAPATAPGRSGIAIVRVSGPRVNEIQHVITGCHLPPRQAVHLPFRQPSGEVIDVGIAILFPAPNSFTGEDVLELHGHGGPIVVDLLLRAILKLGARLARPGEFSERAFANGKIDLTQAEAVADLINASSHEAARSAVRSLQGEFSKQIHALKEKIIHLRMHVEAAIDFAEEEIDFLSDKNIAANLQTILQNLNLIQKQAKQGSILREGLSAVIVGKPNVGKSSLLNVLSGKETAIVTNIPGTTRDVLREQIIIDGLPLHIIDTAGLRDSEDVVELEGIRRARQEIEMADVVLYVSDAGETSAIDFHAIIQSMPSSHIIFIQNKIDLVNKSPNIKSDQGYVVISLSARTGTGIDLLKQHLKAHAGMEGNAEGIFYARRRHLDALEKTLQHIKAALTQLNTSRSAELAAEDLRLAQHSLGEITGEFTADDLLGCIFSSFCVGK